VKSVRWIGRVIRSITVLALFHPVASSVSDDRIRWIGTESHHANTLIDKVLFPYSTNLRNLRLLHESASRGEATQL